MRKQRIRHRLMEVQLTNLMDILTIILVFLLKSLVFLQLVTVDTTLPVFNNTPPEVTQEEENKDEKPKLGLSIVINSDGFVIAGQGGVLGTDGSTPSIAKNINGEYDYNALSTKLLEIKTQYPDEWSVILVPDPNINFDTIIKTMDASRENVAMDLNNQPILK